MVKKREGFSAKLVLIVFSSFFFFGCLFYFGYFVPQERIFEARLTTCTELALGSYSDALGLNSGSSLLSDFFIASFDEKEFADLIKIKIKRDAALQKCFENKTLLFTNARDLVMVNVERTKSLQDQRYQKIKDHIDQRAAQVRQRDAVCAENAKKQSAYKSCLESRREEFKYDGSSISAHLDASNKLKSACMAETGYSVNIDSSCKYGFSF